MGSADSMLRLTLIRHANAEWKDASMDDFERPLNPRGTREAEALGKLLMANELVPDLLVASAARRAKQTAEILARKLSLPTRHVHFAEPLYLARPETILAQAKSTGPDVQHLAIVGHNPGLSELARSLAPEGAQVAELATGSACTLTFAVKSWSAVAPEASHVTCYAPPAKLFKR
jgi:phosphohistidine phosphatase